MHHPYGGQGITIIAVTWTEAGLTILVMALRTYTNGFVIHSFKWDYFWALVTLVC